MYEKIVNFFPEVSQRAYRFDHLFSDTEKGWEINGRREKKEKFKQKEEEEEEEKEEGEAEEKKEGERMIGYESNFTLGSSSYSLVLNFGRDTDHTLNLYSINYIRVNRVSFYTTINATLLYYVTWISVMSASMHLCIYIYLNVFLLLQ